MRIVAVRKPGLICCAVHNRLVLSSLNEVIPANRDCAMSRLLQALLWLTLLPSITSAMPETEPPPPLDALIDALSHEVKPGEAMDYMRHVYSTDRWFTFPKFQETAEYLHHTMTEMGLRNVQLLAAPADGVSQFGFWTMPLAWDAKRARLEIVDPVVPPESRMLADYEKVPASLGMWSGPTPPEGITAEVVELKATSPSAVAALNLQGKLVLTSVNPANIKWLLAKAGALGAINSFTENPDLPDGRQWINAWGDNGWAFTKGNTPLLSFSITPRQTVLLRQLLAKGPVRVRAVSESRYYSEKYPYVTAIIPGTDPEEEVLTLGHTSEQGAEDNATGVSAMLESLATLNRLIAASRLPRPKRSIRILTMGEIYGSMHYIATHPDRVRHTIAAMCMDTPAGLYSLAGTEYTFYMNPDVAKSYVDAFILKIAEEYFSKVRRRWHSHEYMTGTDTYLSEPTVGIPTTWGYSGSGVETHHNSEDTPDRVDPRSLRDITVVNAAYLYYLASAGEPEAHWLAEVALNRGYDQVVAAASPFFDRVLVARTAPDLELLLYQGPEKIEYSVDREMQAVHSVGRLAPRSHAAASSLAERLRQFGREQSDRLRDAVNARASALGLPTPIQAKAPTPDPQLAPASTIVVRRKRFGTLPLDDLSPDQREGFPSGAWASVPSIALYWCDGRRNLAEVIRLTRLELGDVKFDFVGYFRFLQRKGYVDFVQ